MVLMTMLVFSGNQVKRDASVRMLPCQECAAVDSGEGVAGGACMEAESEEGGERGPPGGLNKDAGGRSG